MSIDRLEQDLHRKREESVQRNITLFFEAFQNVKRVLEQKGHILNRTRPEELFEVAREKKVQVVDFWDFIQLKLEKEGFETVGRMRSD